MDRGARQVTVRKSPQGRKELDTTEDMHAPLSILCWLLFSPSRRLAGGISVPPPGIEP